jgi:YfiH family protein
MRGKGSKDYSSAIDNSDALITQHPDILLMVQVADCVPILLYDPVNKVIAAIHAGWKGTVKLIVEKTIKKMVDEFGSDPKDIIAGIGPSVGPCCYEVGKEVIHDAGNMKEFIDKRGRFDLWRANESQLISQGLKRSNIKIASVCTMCNKDIYFSSRASGGNTGRFGAGIILK